MALITAWSPFGDAEIAASVEQTLDEVRERVAQAVRDTVPVKSGATRDSITAERTGPNEVTVFGSAVVRYLADGTKAHPIRGHPWLANPEEDFGPVYGTVQHPGTGPNDFLDRASEVIAEETQAGVLDTIVKFWAEG